MKIFALCLVATFLDGELLRFALMLRATPVTSGSTSSSSNNDDDGSSSSSGSIDGSGKNSSTRGGGSGSSNSSGNNNNRSAAAAADSARGAATAAGNAPRQQPRRWRLAVRTVVVTAAVWAIASFLHAVAQRRTLLLVVRRLLTPASVRVFAGAFVAFARVITALVRVGAVVVV